MSFTSKNLQSKKGGLGFIKWATLFFLWMSCIFFAAKAFEIEPVMNASKAYFTTLIFTDSGNNLGTTGIVIDGINGDGTFNGTVSAWTLSAPTVCIGIDCRIAWPTGGGWSSLWSTGTNNSIYYNLWNVGIWRLPRVWHSLAVSGNADITNNVTVGNDVSVAGRINASCGLAASWHGIYIDDGSYIYDSSCDGWIIIPPSATLHMQSDDDIRIHAGSNTGIYMSNTSERVGIGTTTPAYTLDVNGTGSFKGVCINGVCKATWPSALPAGSDTQLQFNNLGVFGASANLVWNNINSKLGVIGSVGIGIAVPSVTLDVAGQAKFWIGESDWEFIINDWPNWTNVMEVDNGAQQKVIFDSDNFWYDIGIGNVNPLERLDVAGGVRLGMMTPYSTSVQSGYVYTINRTENFMPGGMTSCPCDNDPESLDCGGTFLLWTNTIWECYDEDYYGTPDYYDIYSLSGPNYITIDACNPWTIGYTGGQFLWCNAPNSIPKLLLQNWSDATLGTTSLWTTTASSLTVGSNGTPFTSIKKITGTTATGTNETLVTLPAGWTCATTQILASSITISTTPYYGTALRVDHCLAGQLSVMVLDYTVFWLKPYSIVIMQI